MRTIEKTVFKFTFVTITISESKPSLTFWHKYLHNSRQKIPSSFA